MKCMKMYETLDNRLDKKRSAPRARRRSTRTYQNARFGEPLFFLEIFRFALQRIPTKFQQIRIVENIMI